MSKLPGRSAARHAKQSHRRACEAAGRRAHALLRADPSTRLCERHALCRSRQRAPHPRAGPSSMVSSEVHAGWHTVVSRETRRRSRRALPARGACRATGPITRGMARAHDTLYRTIALEDPRADRRPRPVSSVMRSSVRPRARERLRVSTTGRGRGRPVHVRSSGCPAERSMSVCSHGAPAIADVDRIANCIAAVPGAAPRPRSRHRDLKAVYVLFERGRAAEARGLRRSPFACGAGTLTEAGTVLGTGRVPLTQSRRRAGLPG